MYGPEDHTWVVCVYGDSPYLEDCLRSLQAQTLGSRVLLSASPGGAFPAETAERFGLPPAAAAPGGGIGADWNAALALARTKLVTLAHQDDLYDPHYLETVLRALNRSRDPIIAFSGYRELREGRVAADNRNLRIKRAMLLPLRSRALQRSRPVRRCVLALGDPICCPAVTYVKARTDGLPFSTEMRVSLDWDEWERLSRLRGSFVYCPEPLMLHRVHPGSETTRMIGEKRRSAEDLDMYRRFWPEPVARRLAGWYARAEKSNRLRKGA